MNRPKPIVLVSACLLGQPVRYDGKSKPVDLSALRNSFSLVAVCPECAGGLPIPRVPCEIEETKTAADVLSGRGRILSKAGKDCTEAYIKGAQLCSKIAQKYHTQYALLKEKSPACGTHFIHSGNFDGRLRAGKGVFAESLSLAGVKVFNEQEINELMISFEKSHRVETVSSLTQC